MLSELQAVALCLLCLQNLYLLFHCKEWKDERQDFQTWIRNSASEFNDGFQEYGALLEEIADGMGTTETNHPPADFKQGITQALIQSLILPKLTGVQNGTEEKQVGQVFEGELGSTSKQIQERIQHQERGSDISDDRRIIEDDIRDESPSVSD